MSRSGVGLLLAAVMAGSVLAAATAFAPARSEDELREAARLRGLALAEMEDGNCGRAVEHLEALAAILPDNILPPINLAICFEQLGRTADALAQVARARSLDPRNPQALFAQARILETAGSPERHEGLLAEFERLHPRDPRPHYLRALALERKQDFAAAVEELRAALRLAPENLVLMVELLATAAEAGDATALEDAVYAIEDRLNGFEGSQQEYADQILETLTEADPGNARPPALVLRNLLRPTELYQISRIPLIGGRGTGSGMFPQQDFDPALPKSIQGGQDIEIAFARLETEGRPAGRTAAGLGVTREPGVERVLLSGSQGASIGAWNGGSLRFTDLELAPPPGAILVHADIDQDGTSDLVTATEDGAILVYLARAGSWLRGQEVHAGGSEVGALVPADLDHDGDLDLFVGRRETKDLFLRYDGEGSWTEMGEELGVSGEPETTTAAGVADYDDDGDLDLLILSGGGSRLYLNRRAGSFEAASGTGLEEVAAGARNFRTADFDNDGKMDVVLWGGFGGHVFGNTGGQFASRLSGNETDETWNGAVVGDFDNDGDQDIVASTGGDLTLFRNRRPQFVRETLASGVGAVTSMSVADLDDDGDLDVAGLDREGAPRFFRNEGGNRNQWVRLSLLGRNDNNSKNNTQGLHSRVESRAGDHFQVVLGNGGVNHLGLGASRQADVLRVVWTNGVAQVWQQVASRRTMVEEQVLKGSCPFLYTWDGRAFTFHTDLMWRSPLGMVFADGRAAPHQSAMDFVLIPGERLEPAGGDLWLQVTEELWETAYIDRQQLMAVDYPASFELVVDEGFRPPPYPRAPELLVFDGAARPQGAFDHTGADVLEEIRERDEVYVDSLPLDRYQGRTLGHHLTLDFGAPASAGRLFLALWGWTFPTDTTINVALSQDATRAMSPPRLEALVDGQWQLVSRAIGIPNGKRKAMLVELPDWLLGRDLVLRISTNFQIYWDAAWIATPAPDIEPRITRLDPVWADLHYRGYSKLVRASESSPHLFDYDTVSTGPRFRDMSGRFTRFGRVESLLTASDDLYVVMNAGDEMTVRFDAARAPEVPAGWRRDWILFTDGWVKDGDLHTRESSTVEPLPYRRMTGYPDPAGHRPPAETLDDPLRTRQVSDRPFVDALRDQGDGASVER